MSSTPYIGITGFTNQNDVWQCLQRVPAAPQRQFMVGVLLSSKTINGGTNKYPVRYPHYRDIKGVFLDDPRCLNMIHYVTDDKSTLVKQLLDAAEIGGEHCHGFQLNIVWPDIDMLCELKRELPNHKIVIQCSGSAMRLFEGSDDTPRDLKQTVSAYEERGLIDYLLIDPSGGRGKSFDADKTISLLKPHNNVGYALGVAGGLRAATINNLIPVLKEQPNLFWDAEGGLRNEEDGFILEAALEYLDLSFGFDSLLNAKEKNNENT